MITFFYGPLVASLRCQIFRSADAAQRKQEGLSGLNSDQYALLFNRRSRPPPSCKLVLFFAVRGSVER